MKTNLLFFALLAVGSIAAAAEKIAAGPKGGRLLDSAPHRAEFFVTPERTVRIAFYDAALKPVAPGERVVIVTAEPASGRVPIALEKTSDGFVSKAALPAGEPYRVVIQVREKPGATPKNFRIDLNLGPCGECQRAEYACICGH